MTKSAPNSTDRARAFRIRDMIAKGKPISADKKAWLEAYEQPGAKLPAWAAAKPTKPRMEVRAEQATVVDSAPWRPIGRAPASSPAADDDERDRDDDDEQLEDERDEDSGTHEVPPSPATPTHTDRVCLIENCPACAGQLDKGPQICVKTGKPVWPQISDNGARMLAGVILFAIGFGVRIAYGQREIVDPTELELEALADAIKAVVRRRAGWVQAFDDLLGTAWGIGAYTKRARKVKQLPPARESEAAT
jgi:hypothetical protein